MANLTKIFFLAMLCIFFASYAQDSKVAIKTFANTPKETTEWVQLYIEQYPELLWLADEKVQATEEGKASFLGSYSEQIFGRKYIEFDRTLMTLRCLKLILEGSEEAYREFTQDQPAQTRLTWKSYRELHEQGMHLLKSKKDGMSESQIVQAMKAALVLGDIGKSEKARERFKSYGINAPDHDDFYGEAIKIIATYPQLSPTYGKLPLPAQKLLSKVAHLAHYGHITHLEGGPKMLEKLKASQIGTEDPIALHFDLFVHTCDVAGALGHVNQLSSLSYDENTHRALQAMAKSVQMFQDPFMTEERAFNAYLDIRAGWLGLNTNDKLQKILTRIGCMIRLFHPEEGVALLDGIKTLRDEQRHQIISLLDPHLNLFSRTPTYMPAVLINLSYNPILGSTKESRLQNTILIGLPFLAKVLEKYQTLLREGAIDPDIPLNFNQAAGYAKSHPQALEGGFQIDENGVIHLYQHLVENSHFDPARQSQMEASRSERGSPSRGGKGAEKDQFGKAVAKSK